MRFYVRNTFSTRGYRIYLVLSARLVKLYVLSAQHVKCCVSRDEHVQTGTSILFRHSSFILTIVLYYLCYSIAV